MARRARFSPRFTYRSPYRRNLNQNRAVRRFGTVMALRQRRFGGRSVALRNMRTGGLLGIETKYLDLGINNALVATTDATGGECQPDSGSTGCLTAPAQGDGSQNRDGKKIVVKSILVTGTISSVVQTAQNSADVVPEVYLALVQDTQTNGVTINSEDVFTNVAGIALTATVPFRNMSNVSRFRVLKTVKKKLVMPSMTADAGTGTIVQSGQASCSIALSWTGLMPVNFTTASTTADVANVVDNSVHLIAYCNSTTLAPAFAGACRIRFVG